MDKVMKFAVCGAVALALSCSFSGCCMQLDERENPKIQEIIDAHKNELNREEELKLLCDKAWTPVYIKRQEGTDGKDVIVLPKDLLAYLVFDRSGSFKGFAGVNDFNGSFAVITPNQLRFGAMKTTEMSGTHLDYEMLFLAQLTSSDNFVIQPDGTLELRKHSELLIRFKPLPLSQVKNLPKAKVAPAASKSADAKQK